MLTVAMVFDTAQVLGFLSHRQYQFYDAASPSRQSWMQTQRTPPLVWFEWRPVSLMTGIPSINDGYSNQDLRKNSFAISPAGM